MVNYISSVRWAVGFALGCLLLDTIIVAFEGEGFGEIAWSIVTLVTRELAANQSRILNYYVGDEK